MESSWIYKTITGHWHQVATGWVLLLGIAELVAGGFTAESELEWYLFAWAGITGGIWFLFEIGEKSLSQQAREQLSSFITGSTIQGRFQDIPDQFAHLFDWVFGHKHFSIQCFIRSCEASLAGTLLIYSLALGASALDVVDGTFPLTSVFLFPDLQSSFLANFEISKQLVWFALIPLLGLFFNFIPDYLSLLETRWLIERCRNWNLALVLLLDCLLTASIFLFWFFGWVFGMLVLLELPLDQMPNFLISMLTFSERGIDASLMGVFFYSTFFTSIWLWTYIVAVFLSRFLVKLNTGIGFLLLVTDAENQPLRSLGFTSILVISTLFFVGLPSVII